MTHSGMAVEVCHDFQPLAADVSWPFLKKDMVLIPRSALSGDIWLPVFLG